MALRGNFVKRRLRSDQIGTPRIGEGREKKFKGFKEKGPIICKSLFLGIQTCFHIHTRACTRF